jgi:hypothetical protein
MCADQPDNMESADPHDVESIDAIIRALYECISGPAGQPRDWARQRTLHLPGALLVPVTRVGDAETAEVMSVDEYERSRTPFFDANGFYETEIARRAEQYGSIVQVFSTYESRSSPDSLPFMRGVNAIQLIRERERWWIVSVAWQHETLGNAIPERYLP